ncbi:MAG: NAD(P)-dependent oxidoreductase [Chthoniobacterales bacterium]
MSRRVSRNVGVIGLGIIGRRVANNLRRRAFSAFVWNRTARPFPNFVGTPAEIAELCDFVQIFVGDDEALLEVIQRIKATLTPHHIVMAHCTVSPDTMRTVAEMVQRRGAQFLDAPFTGSKDAAEKGELVYYVGGDEAVLLQARPVLEASSKEIIKMGEIGDATIMKVATNMVTAATVQAAVEALAIVHNSGLPADKFAIAMRSNGSNSGTLEMKLPLMLEGNFEPHFSVKHMLKDVEIATRLARNFGLELGATDAARRCLAEEARAGHDDADYCSVIRRYFPDGIPSAIKADAPANEEDELKLDLTEAEPGSPPRLADIPEMFSELPSPADEGTTIESVARSIMAAGENVETEHFSTDEFAGGRAIAETVESSDEAPSADLEIETGTPDNRPDFATNLPLSSFSEESQAEITATASVGNVSETTSPGGSVDDETVAGVAESGAKKTGDNDAKVRRGLLSYLWRHGDKD